MKITTIIGARPQYFNLSKAITILKKNIIELPLNIIKKFNHINKNREPIKARKILVLGIDVVAKKNTYQFSSLKSFGYFYDILPATKAGNFRKLKSDQHPDNIKIYLSNNVIGRINKAIYLLHKNKYKHCELYAASRIGFIYLFLLKIFKVKILLVERGDIGVYNKYNYLTRLSLKLSYIYAEYILFKEPYMKDLLLEKIKSSKLCFVPNAVPVKEKISANKEIDYLWANRIVPQRNFEWIIQTIIDTAKNKKSLYVLCGLKEHEIEHYSKKIKNNVIFHEYIDLEEIYKKSKFFLLPSTIVFGNFSLLEAMSYGVVPIVTATKDTSLIVQNNHNGIVTDFEYLSYREGIENSLSINEDTYLKLSENARQTVINNFSIEKYATRMNKLYVEISNR